MKHILLAASVFLFAACTMQSPDYSKCEACVDSGAEPDSKQNHPDQSVDTGIKPDAAKRVFPDDDGDGYRSNEDCDDHNSAVYPGAKEVCDNEDNDCNGQIDDNPVDVGKPCGLDGVGLCKASRICNAGQLECQYSVSPQKELCNGKDDDCDNSVDEDWPELGNTCESGLGECTVSGYLICNGSATKLVCGATPLKPGDEGPPGYLSCYNEKDDDCDGLVDLDDPSCIFCLLDAECDDGNKCTKDECGGGVCKNNALPENTPCPDGIYCNGSEKCLAGICQSGPKVLCDDADQCTQDACDETQKKCVFTALPYAGQEGPPGDADCLDGLDNDCDSKTDLADPDCVGCKTDFDCLDKGACVNRACNSSKICVYTNKADGASCSDGKYCNGEEMCQAGVCLTGTFNVSACDDGDSCTADVCDWTLNKCTNTPIAGCKACTNSLECDDGDSCTTDTCTGGKCYSVNKADGTSCNDGAFCTVGDQCFNGICLGTPRDCYVVADACNTSVCDDALDQCKKLPKANGTSCDNNFFCDGHETCQNGICHEGTPVECASSDPCKVGSCNELQKICIFSLIANPGAENWSLSGVCSDGKDNDCDGYADYSDTDCRQCQYSSDCSDGNPCTQDTCSSVTWKCEYTNLNNTSCDDGKWCTVSDFCSNGTCIGATRDCSLYNDECNYGTCDEASDTCVKSYKTNSAPCNDGKWCTIGDYCIYGQCVSGGARNCGSGYYCDESLDQCVLSATGCTDGTREGFVDASVFPNIAGCSGTWASPGLSSGAYLCASGWHICYDYQDVAQNMPSGKDCSHAWNGSDKRFFATLQPSAGYGYCGGSGTNDVFGCGNYGHTPAGGCGLLNYFSSEDCMPIKYPYSGAPETWRCGNTAVDSSDELTTVVKLQEIGGGVLCCKY